VPAAAVALLKTLNGLSSVPFPLEPCAGSTNQVTGPDTLKVTIAGALSTPGAGQPVSCTRYVKLTGPVTPGGGVHRNYPYAAATTEPPNGLVVLMLPGVIVNVFETHPLTPLSAASETPESKPTPAGMSIGMFACAEKLLFVTVGGSFTALTVIVNVW